VIVAVLSNQQPLAVAASCRADVNDGINLSIWCHVFIGCLHAKLDIRMALHPFCTIGKITCANLLCLMRGHVDRLPRMIAMGVLYHYSSLNAIRFPL
jgi:hypothetical protein